MGIVTKKRRSDAIWLFNFPSLEALSGDQDQVLFVSERDINIIYQGLKDIDRFITRVFVSAEGDLYTSVDNEQFETFKQWQSDLFNHIGDWRVTNEILIEIRDAILALEGTGCGCGGIEGSDGGSGGAGTAPAPPSGTVTDDEAREGPAPPGFATWPERDQYACDMANYIFDQLLIDVATASSITIGLTAVTELATLLAGLLLTPVGWVALLGIATIMISAAILTGFYSAIITHLEANRDEYVCAILAGTDVGSSISSFSDKVDEILPGDTGFEDPVTGYIATNFVKSFASIDSFNRLYAKIVVDMPSATCDCLPDLASLPFIQDCASELVAGDLSGTFTFESCVGSVFGGTRSIATVVSTGIGVARSFTSFSSVTGPTTLNFGYVDDEGTQVELGNIGFGSIPSPLIAQAFQFRHTAVSTEVFQIQCTVAEV